MLKLGIVVSNRSVCRYRGQPPRRPSQTRRTFLRNHARTIWAADLFAGQTLTFRTRYVLLLFAHGRRELAHVGVTGLGIEKVVTPVRAPKANAIAERVVRTLRNDCLDHLIPLNEAHPRAVLA